MNGKRLILDTNAVIMLLDNAACSRFLDDHFPGNVRCISVITQIELLSYPDITREADGLIRSFLADIPIIAIEGGIVEAAIHDKGFDSACCRNPPHRPCPRRVKAALVYAPLHKPALP